MTIDKRQVARQFSRAATNYDRQAMLQQAMADRLLDSLTEAASGHLIDLGCGTGDLMQKIAYSTTSRFTTLTGVDFAPGMIEIARQRENLKANWICEDLETTSLPNGCADVIISNAALQWCNLANALQEVARLLSRPGYFVAATFGPRTLEQLKSAWHRVDPECQHVHEFESAESIQTLMEGLGFAGVTIDQQFETLLFDSPNALLNSVRGLGATYADQDRSRSRVTRQSLTDLKQALRETAYQDEQFLLTYECLYVSACKPAY